MYNDEFIVSNSALILVLWRKVQSLITYTSAHGHFLVEKRPLVSLEAPSDECCHDDYEQGNGRGSDCHTDRWVG